jgi:hypothetical protein
MAEEVKLKGYIARSCCVIHKDIDGQHIVEENDTDGALHLYLEKPKREKYGWHSKGEKLWLSPPGKQTMFTNLTWKDEPRLVEITIKAL